MMTRMTPKTVTSEPIRLLVASGESDRCWTPMGGGADGMVDMTHSLSRSKRGDLNRAILLSGGVDENYGDYFRGALFKAPPARRRPVDGGDAADDVIRGNDALLMAGRGGDEISR